MTVRAVEGKKPYTWGKAIEITEDKVINLRLREENNLIIYDEGDNEIYTDLQLDDEIRPTDAFPVGVTTGRVIVDNWWDVTGTILIFKTTSWDYGMILYGDDGKVYMDNWTGILKPLILRQDLLEELEGYIKYGVNQVWDDDTEVQIWRWRKIDEHTEVCSKWITLDPKWAIKTYNSEHTADRRETKLDDGVLELKKTLHLGYYQIVDIDFQGITAEDSQQQESRSYPFFGQHRIATLDDIQWGWSYSAGNWINIDANNEISVDTSVVATQNDISVVSGDSGTTYTIKVSNTAPSAGTPDTTLTFVY